MSRDGPRRNSEPRIDLETVRDTLRYMHDDMAAVPRLAAVQAALSAALREIETIEASSAGSKPVEDQPRVVAFPVARPRFVAWSPKA
ncbi:MAG: hypothetical protein AB7O57_01585 [Hyphomicrobiaceae bacterium]